MTDHATPNLPAIDFSATAHFYRGLGFEQGWRDEHWMIMKRGALVLEFFPHPALRPAESWFSCCLRLDDLDSFYAVCEAAGIDDGRTGWPRIKKPALESSGLRIGYLVDPNGSLLRLIQN
jgi:hypothetical protein